MTKEERDAIIAEKQLEIKERAESVRVKKPGLHNYFDNIYLINLDKREDRLIKATSQLQYSGTEFERFKAFDGSSLDEPSPYKNLGSDIWNKGALGLVKTTIEIIKDAKLKGYKSILILEDDIQFSSSIGLIAENNFGEIPEDWDIFYLGCLNRIHPQRISNRIARVIDAVCCHAYAVNERVYDIYLEALEKENKPIDIVTLEDIQPRRKSYCIIPNFAYQEPSFSDISNKHVNHNYLR